MKIWRFRDPRDKTYAKAARRGAWSASGGVCVECTASGQHRVKPLIMEWEPSSDVVGDFSWPGFGFEVVVTDLAAAALGPFSGFELETIEVAAPDRGESSVPREWPRLHEVWVSRWVHLDQQRSTARRVSACGTCGAEVWDVERPGAGVVVTEANLGIFRVRELPGWAFCTDEVVVAVREAKLTNAGFLEMGEQLVG